MLGTPRRFKIVVILSAALLSLAGCVKMDTRLTVGSDDTVDGSAVVAVDKSLLTLGGRDPQAAFEDAEQGMDELPEGARVEPYEDDQFYGKKVVFTNVPLSEFSGDRADMPLITHADGLYTFEMDLGPDKFGRSGADARMMQPFLNSLRIHVEVTFPGKVIESNGTLDGRTVTWDVRVGVDDRLKAVAEEPSPIPDWAMFAAVGGGLALLVVGAIVAFALWLRRQAAAADAATGDAAAGVATTTGAAADAVPPAADAGTPATAVTPATDGPAQTPPVADQPAEPSS